MNPAVNLPPRGLPEHLPAGERVLWQGAPEWRSFARRALHMRWVIGYFALMLAWRVASDWSDGAQAGELILSAVRFLAYSALAVGMLYLFAWLTQRTTVYTITDRRVVMRIGIALPVTFNIPFSAIEVVRLAETRDGVGDLPLVLAGGARIAYLHLVPHARPWRFARPEPMIRAVANAGDVAGILTRAMTATLSGMAAQASVPEPSKAASRQRRIGALTHSTEEIPA